MNLGGASAVAVAANIFMGMVESPIVIRAYLDKLSRAELFLMMVVGLATVAGSTMVAYAVILGPVLPNAAGHVLVASIISAPAGILLARIMIPEEHKAGVPYDHTGALKYESSMDAITRGVQDGVMVAVNVAAFIIVFVAFVWIGNNLLASGQVAAVQLGLVSPDAEHRHAAEHLRLCVRACRLRDRHSVERIPHGRQYPRREALPHRVHRLHRVRRHSGRRDDRTHAHDPHLRHLRLRQCSVRRHYDRRDDRADAAAALGDHGAGVEVAAARIHGDFDDGGDRRGATGLAFRKRSLSAEPFASAALRAAAAPCAPRRRGFSPAPRRSDVRCR